MADGDFIDQGHQTQIAFWRSFALIDSATATSTGAGKWVDVRGFKNFTLDVSGIGTATGVTVQLRGANDKAKPSDTDDGRQIGSNITADGFTDVTTSPRWMKGIVSAFNAGKPSARINMTAGG